MEMTMSISKQPIIFSCNRQQIVASDGIQQVRETAMGNILQCLDKLEYAHPTTIVVHEVNWILI